MGTDTDRQAGRARRATLVVVGLVALAAGAGCSDRDDDPAATVPTTAPATTTAATDPAPEPTDDIGSPTTTAPADPAAPTTASTAPTTTGTTSTGPPPPAVLGVPGDFGMEYPVPTTCDQAGAFVATLDPDAVAVVAQGDGSFIWLAVDEASASADLFSDAEPDRTLVRIRAGSVDFEGAPTVAELPALGSDVSYAVSTIAPDGSMTDCVEGPVVG